MSKPAPPSREGLLRELSSCINSLQQILDSQPVFATQMSTALRQELGELVPDQSFNPDAVFLNEYIHEASSNAPRITRSRNLTRVLQDAFVTRTPSDETLQTVIESPSMGFYRSEYGAGEIGNITAIEIDVFNALIDDMKQNSLENYQRKLNEFWSSSHSLTGTSSVHDTVSRQLFDMLRIEADLKWVTAQEKDKDVDLTLLNDGRQLIENLRLHETSNRIAAPNVVGLTLYDPDTPEWSVPILCTFILSEKLHSTRPVVLYTPQFGGETFENFSESLTALRLRLVSGPAKELLLANVPASKRAQASEVLKSGQNLRFEPITGPVFSQCLQALRAQQQEDIAKTFSTPIATFDGLGTALQATLTLPLTGNKSLRDRLPAPLDPMTQTLEVHTTPEGEKQKELIRLWDELNEQIDSVLDKGKHPSLDGVLSALLKETFMPMPNGSGPDALYVNSYSTDSSGTRQLKSSQPIREALFRRLVCDYLEEDEDDPVAYGVFSSPSAIAQADEKVGGCNLQGLADSLQRRLLESVTAYWHTPIAPGLPCPQVKLNDLFRQCLDVQSRLLFIDNTLSPSAKLLINRTLHFTTQARREANFRHGQRPGVYQLTLDSASPQGERLAASVVLTPSDGSMSSEPHWPNGHKNLSTQGVGGPIVQGPVVLYTPVQGFEEFSTLQMLHATLTKRIDAGQGEGQLLSSMLPMAAAQDQDGLFGDSLRNVFMPIEGDFIADSVQSLLSKQQDDISILLTQGDSWGEDDFKAVCGAADVERNGRAELVELLDMSNAFMARNLLLLARYLPDWEKNLRAEDKARLQTLEQTALEKQQALAKLWAVIPALSEYARRQVLLKVRELPDVKALIDKASSCTPVPQPDPDRTVVTRTEHVRIGYDAGFGSTHERTYAERMSLTQLVLRNTHPWEKSLSWTSVHHLEATLVDETGKWMLNSQHQPIVLTAGVLETWLKELNVGPKYIDSVLKQNLFPDPMTSPAQALKDAWFAALTANLSYAQRSAELSPDAYFTPLVSDNSQKKGAAWVAAVLASPEPQTRLLVDGQAVSANALMFNPASHGPEGRGGETVNGVLMISTDVSEATVLYAPDAPDGQLLRELKSEQALAALLQAPVWLAYFKARLPANTRLVNPRLARYTGSFLSGMYRQNYLHLVNRADEQTTSNEELQRQSTFNKVMFGVEVALTALGGLPGASTFAGSTAKWIMRLGGSMLKTLRSVGRSIPGLIVGRGFAGRVTVQMAAGSANLAGAERIAGTSLRPLSLLLTPGRRATRSMPPALLTNYERAFQRESARLAVKGGIPAGSSLSEGTNIYRSPGSPSSLMVRVIRENDELVLRIQDGFKLYDPNGLVVRVLSPTGAATPFRLRLMPDIRRWVLDTVERLPGGIKMTAKKLDLALAQWRDELARSPQRVPPITPAEFFNRRDIPLKSWEKFVKRNGEFSQRGTDRLALGGAGNKLTDDIFMGWAADPNKTKEGARRYMLGHGIREESWSQLVRPNGELTLAGNSKVNTIVSARLTGKPVRYITDEHLIAWWNLSRNPAYKNKNSVLKFAFDNNIHSISWLKYVKNNGDFRVAPFLIKRLTRLNIPVAGPSVPRSPVPGPSTSQT